MCDYSLEQIASRDAVVGDRLVSTRFGDSITRGFSGVGDPTTAVCLRPGTEIAFDRDVEYENILGAGRAIVAAKVARFRQVDTEAQHLHHDALEFPDDQVVLLTRLVPGQRASVLQLPAMMPLDEKAAERTSPQTVA
ncbi:MAG: hypothetical protein ACRECO_21735 [Xanthobacteraceae bacterium]